MIFPKWLIWLIHFSLIWTGKSVDLSSGSANWFPRWLHLRVTGDLPASTGAQAPIPEMPTQCLWNEAGYGSFLKPPRVILECEELGLKAAALAQTLTGATCTPAWGHGHLRWTVAELCAGGWGSTPNVWWPFGLFSWGKRSAGAGVGHVGGKATDWLAPLQWVQMLQPEVGAAPTEMLTKEQGREWDGKSS